MLLMHPMSLRASRWPLRTSEVEPWTPPDVMLVDWEGRAQDARLMVFFTSQWWFDGDLTTINGGLMRV